MFLILLILCNNAAYLLIMIIFTKVANTTETARNKPIEILKVPALKQIYKIVLLNEVQQF